jgi:hypothetical protein
MGAPKYSKQLTEYTNHTLSDDEKNLFKVFIDELKKEHNIDKLSDAMLLDTTMNDFIRIKRLQKVIQDHGDTYMWENRQGTQTVRVNEASKLILQLENQFRNNMKELLMTKRSSIVQQLKTGDKSFSDFINAKEVKAKIEKPKEEKKEVDKNDALDFFTVK